MTGGGHLHDLNHMGCPSRRGPDTSTLLHAISKLQCVVPCCCLKFFLYAKWYSTYSEHRDQTIEASAVKRGRGHLQEVVVSERL